jgi:hypothetical protein
MSFLVGQLRQCGADGHAIVGVSDQRCRNDVWRSVAKVKRGGNEAARQGRGNW